MNIWNMELTAVANYRFTGLVIQNYNFEVIIE